MAEGLMFHDEAGELLHAAPPPIVAELRYMVGRLQLQDGKSGVPPRVGVVASLSGEGTTFVSRSLAAVLAEDLGEPTCIVDLNWWSLEPDPVQRPGIAQIVGGGATLGDVLVRTDQPNLCYLPAGEQDGLDGSVLARSRLLRETLDEVEDRGYRLVLDLPPLLLTSEALTMASHVEACMLVVRQGVTFVSEVREAIDHLQGTAVMGVILNQATSHVPRSLLRRITANGPVAGWGAP